MVLKKNLARRGKGKDAAGKQGAKARNRDAGRYYAKKLAIAKGHAPEIKTMDKWRNLLDIRANTPVDRALAFLIKSVQKRHGRGAREWQSALESKLTGLIGQELGALQLSIMCEEYSIDDIKREIAGAKKPAQAAHARTQLGIREKILKKFNEHLAAGKPAAVVYYGDATVPEWYKVSLPASPVYKDAKANGWI